MRVAFLGLGRMGAAMAGHVRAADHQLVVWNRTPKQFEGATVAESIAEAVREAECVVLMLFGPDSVREVLADIVTSAPKDSLIIDSTTVGPAASREFAATAARAGLRFIDAPVAGSVGPATTARSGCWRAAATPTTPPPSRCCTCGETQRRCSMLDRSVRAAP